MDLKEIVNESLLDIRVGPKNMADEDDIKQFVESKGINCISIKSKGTYV